MSLPEPPAVAPVIVEAKADEPVSLLTPQANPVPDVASGSSVAIRSAPEAPATAAAIAPPAHAQMPSFDVRPPVWPPSLDVIASLLLAAPAR